MNVLGHPTIYLEATQSQVVASRAVLPNLYDAEVAEPVLIGVRGLEAVVIKGILIIGRFLVNVRVDTPGRSGPFLAEQSLFCRHLLVELRAVREVDSSIQ